MAIKKVNYEISLWSNNINHKQESLITVDGLKKNETYLVNFNFDSTESSYYEYACLYSISNDGNYYNFRSYSISDDGTSIKQRSIAKTNLIKCVKNITAVPAEEKICILGSDSMVFEGKARDCRLVTSLRANELTFSLPQRYCDYSTGKFVHNDLVDRVKEESLIKLKFGEEWYDFVVKEIVESREQKIKFYSYRCVDLFVEELSRQGWVLNLDEESGMGTIDELVPKIIEGTDWEYIPVYNNEIEQNSDPFMEKKTEILVDDFGNIIFEDGKPKEEEQIQRTSKMVWSTTLKRMVKEYDELYSGTIEGATYINEPIYSYETLKDISISSCENLLSNSENFNSIEFWEGLDGTIISTFYNETAQELYLNFSGSPVDDLYSSYNYNINQSSGEYNKTLEIDSIYALSLNFKTSTTINDFQFSFSDDSTSLSYSPSSFENNSYYIFKTEKELQNFVLNLTYSSPAENLNLLSISLFSVIPRTKDTSIPESILDSWIDLDSLKEYSLTPNEIEIIDPYQYLQVQYFIENNNDIIKFKPTEELTEKTTCRKVRTLVGSRSNRLSLLEDIAELFDGYPIFTIKHDNMGNIIYSNGKPEKYITFKEIITQENTGKFLKYGHNLSSITRTNLTDEIITKLYVEHQDSTKTPISIADSQYNPCGETYLIDLSYYVNRGEIDSQQYYNDIYSNNESHLGYFNKLKKYNDVINDKAKQQGVLLQNLEDLKSRQIYTESLMVGCDKLIAEAQESINNDWSLTDEESETIKLNTIKKNNLTQELNKIKNAINTYESKIAQLDTLMLQINRMKNNLINYFESKYSKYIKEGLWSDPNYLSSDTYYLDALRVFGQSSKAKVSYSYNAIDLRILPDYKDCDFKTGDKILVEDMEFFGVDDSGKPITEEALVTNVEYLLDEPYNNTITVQNFISSFEDLFERIGQAVISAELK